MSDYLKARTNMVESQLRPNGVLAEALIGAFQAVPREFFVPERFKGAAYIDEDLPLGGGRYVMAPLTLARLLQAAAIGSGDTVLVVAGTTGYGAALAGKLGRTVTLLEADAKLAAQARTALRRAGLQNVSVIEGEAAEGYAARAPYDVIILEGATDALPPALTQQLAAGGRIATVLRETGEAALVSPDIAVIGRAMVMTKASGGLSSRILIETGTPILPGFATAPGFVL